MKNGNMGKSIFHIFLFLQEIDSCFFSESTLLIAHVTQSLKLLGVFFVDVSLFLLLFFDYL
jgi:hypothetical protein